LTVPNFAQQALPSSVLGKLIVDSVFLLSTWQRQSDLRNRTHRELVNRSFQFNKRSQDFVGAHDEALSVAMRVNNPDRLTVGIDR